MKSLSFFFNLYEFLYYSHILLQGVIHHEKTWKFFLISVGLNNDLQRLFLYIKRDETEFLKERMKDYTINVTFFEMQNMKKIDDFQSYPLDFFANKFLSLNKSDEMVDFFKKLNILVDLPKFYKLLLICYFQKEPPLSEKQKKYKLKQKLELELFSDNFSKNQNSMDKNQFNANLFGKEMNFGLEIKIYVKGKEKFFTKVFRLHFISSLKILVSVYESFTQRTDYCQINDLTNISILQSLLSMKNKKLLWKNLRSHFTYQRTIIGKKLYFNRIDPECLLFTQNYFKSYTEKDLLNSTQHAYLLAQYRTNIYYGIFNVSVLGKSFVKLRIFYPFNPQANINLIKIKIEFFPIKKRWKVFKLIFSYGDFKKYYKQNIEFLSIRNIFNVLNKIIFPRILLYKSNISYSLALTPKFSIKNQILRMNFHKQNELLQLETLKYRIVGQFIKKILGYFAVITIKYNIHLNFWTSTIYFPKTNRTISFSIYSRELAQLSNKFWKDIFQVKKKIVYRNRSTYTKKDTENKSIDLSKGHPLLKFSIENNLSIKKEINFSQQNLIDKTILNSLLKVDYRDFKDKFIDLCKGVKPEVMLTYLSKKSNFLFDWNKQNPIHRNINNYEFIFWDHFLKKSSLKILNNEKYIFISDIYQGIIREILFEKIFDTHFYQIHFERKFPKKKLNINNENNDHNDDLNLFKSFRKKEYENSKNFCFYIRAISLKTLRKRNFCFQEYFPIIKENSTEDSSINLEEKTNFKGIIQSFDRNPEKFLNQISENSNNIFKRKCLKENCIFLLKGVLVARKRYLASFFYKLEPQEFHILLYNQKNSKIINLKIKLDLIQKTFPYVKFILEKGETQILGLLLMKILKNILILYVFTHNFI